VDAAKKVGLTLFVVAWPFLAASFLSSMIQPSTSGFLFLFLLLLSGLMFVSTYASKRMGLHRRGKLIMALVIVGILVLFFVPAVQTLASGGDTSTVCRGTVCASVTQWASLTDFHYCVGVKYQFDTIDGRMVIMNTGCPPPM
jgi:peptidoglycan/LPS O-acetylase OafA/YrhL